MKAYTFSIETKEYVGREIEVQENPMWNEGKPVEERWLNPGYSLIKDIPYKAPENKVWIANLLIKDWELKDDFRGTKYWEKNGNEKEITEIGVKVPDECLTSPPPVSSDNTHDGISWNIDYDKVRSELLQKASKKRKEIEISGVNITGVSCDDFYLETDEDGQTKIFGAVTIAAQDLTSSTTTKWKTLSGWREVKNSDIIIMGLTVRSHINNTFKQLEVIEEEINQLNNSELSDYLINFSQ